MTEQEKRPIKYNIHNTDALRELLIQNPDLPLVILAGEDANTGDFNYMFCTSVHAEIGEILNCHQEINDEICYTDREEFETDIYELIANADTSEGHTDEWYEAEAQKAAAEYDPYWQKCILLTVDN